MNVADFDFALPAAAIAQEPAAERDASRLMVLDPRTGATAHRVFRDLPDLLAPGDLVVVNRSRVVPARLLGQRSTGGAVEILLVRDHAGGRWDAFLRPGRRVRAGETIRVSDELAVAVDTEAQEPDGRRAIRLLAADPEGALERAGHVPLPPYVRRSDRPADRERYQTVYAREKGSVAAPTAGLHFTPALLERLRDRGIGTAEVLLHVGPGTFRPVAVDDVRDHRVAAEPYVLPEATARAIDDTRARGGRVVAVGTTTVRTLETCARADGRVAPGAGETDLVIVPGFRFRATDVLVTNFHLPRSSLLLLVAAFAGREAVLEAYAAALRAGYRFYSYGDAMLIVRPA